MAFIARNKYNSLRSIWIYQSLLGLPCQDSWLLSHRPSWLSLLRHDSWNCPRHETAQDIAPINPIVNVFRDEIWQQKKTDYFQNILPSKLTGLYKLLGDKKFFCGDVVTYCDFAVYHQLDLCRLVVTTVFDEYPKINQWMKNVEALAGVKEYLEKRPVPVDIGTRPMLKSRIWAIIKTHSVHALYTTDIGLFLLG